MRLAVDGEEVAREAGRVAMCVDRDVSMRKARYNKKSAVDSGCDRCRGLYKCHSQSCDYCCASVASHALEIDVAVAS
jgi:hypothetical protein